MGWGGGEVFSLVHLIGFILCVCEIVFYELYSGTRRTVTTSSLQITFFFFFNLEKRARGKQASLGFHGRGDSSSFRRRCFGTGSRIGTVLFFLPFSSLPPSSLPFSIFLDLATVPGRAPPGGRESATRGPLGCPGPAGRSTRFPQSRQTPGEARGGPPVLPALGWELGRFLPPLPASGPSGASGGLHESTISEHCGHFLTGPRRGRDSR